MLFTSAIPLLTRLCLAIALLAPQGLPLTQLAPSAHPNPAPAAPQAAAQKEVSRYPGAELPLAEGADLSVLKTGLPDPVNVGAPLTYEITVTNLSPRIDAAGVRLVDTLPQGVTFVRATSGCAATGNTVICVLGNLAGGGSIAATIFVTAPAGMGLITNTVDVSANEPDPNPANNRATLTTLVVEPPLSLVSEGLISYAVAAPKIFTHTHAPLICGEAPGVATGSAGFETIGRVAMYGSPLRLLRSEARGCTEPNDVLSNIVADARFVYWVNASGLVRLPTSANPGDRPELLSSAFSGTAELAQDDVYLYASLSGDSIYRVNKANGATDRLTEFSGGATRLSADGEYLYWLTGGVLQRYRLATGELRTLAERVAAYYAEGERPCPAGGCVTRYVFIAQGRQVVRFDNSDNSTSAPIYTSSQADAEIYELSGDGISVFALEERPTPARSDNVVRVPRLGGEARLIRRLDADTVHAADELLVAGDRIYLRYRDDLVMAKKAPDWTIATNLRITGMLVTQGIQGTLAHTVRLIENRRTFVRVFVDSDGPLDVSGVTAHLYGSWGMPVVSAGPVEPINAGGKTITVRRSPDPNNLNDSFLFEVPLDWTTHGNLALRAELNPYHTPSETQYADNSHYEGEFFTNPSPRMELWFTGFHYTHDGQSYAPRQDQDIDAMLSWMRRVYPLASTSGDWEDPSPGLRTREFVTFDNTMGDMVAGTSQWCYDNGFSHTIIPGLGVDLFLFCPSYYSNSVVINMLKQWGGYGSAYGYGMIPWLPGLGAWAAQATDSIMKASSGPALVGETAKAAAHEIGHTSGRAHSFDDTVYPYPQKPANAWAQMGPGDGSFEGLDAGDPALGEPLRIYTDTAADLMSYGFGDMWISDFTYQCLYEFLATGQQSTGCVPPSTGAAGQPAGGTTAPLAGDWLDLSGRILTDKQVAYISSVQRVDTNSGVPPPQPGGYRIQLQNTAGAVLADYPFTPYKTADSLPGELRFSQVVTFAAGSTRVRIANAAGDELGRAAISPNPPTVRDVALQDAANPVTGVVTLNWIASDPDGDPLLFNVLYSLDGGATFRPHHLNITAQQVMIDTATLGGSANARLRVVANDGSRSAHADSATFAMAPKPPRVTILSPADGNQFHYGDPVNLSGEAVDPQDDGIAGANLIWTSQQGVLGTGSFLALTDLAVGVNHVTLTATNTAGLAASASVTVMVDDDLTLAGPTLSVGPAQIGWHVDLGTTQMQTAQMSITNAGSGVLNFSVSSDAAWLTVSPTGGVAPTTVTVTANPTGLPDGTLKTANLVVRGTGDAGGPEQVITVPVTLAAGNVAAQPVGQSKLYLPLVLKSLR